MSKQPFSSDGSELFDASWYLQRYPDVTAAGVNPLAHFVEWGAREGRDPSPLFDTNWYLERNPDVATDCINPLAHYLQRGARLGRDPNPLFDTDWYLERNPDVAAAGINPLAHYLQSGAREGRDPNPLFDTDWYLQRNPDVAAARINPLAHYLQWGARQGRDPGPLFDAAWYQERNPDVTATGMNPLAHYLQWGATEGRVRRSRPAQANARVGLLKVSAVIPCYNGAEWLAEALHSIRAQTAPVHEIILVDDASSDNSVDIAHRYGATVVQNLSNRGEGYSRNVGLRHASGDMIAWLDADDIWMPHHVATLVQLLQSWPQAAAGFAAVQRFGLRDELIRGYVPLGEPSNVFWPAFRDWLHTTIGSMTRRAALLDVGGFDEGERYSVDFDLWLRLSRSHLFVCTHEVTSLWRWHAAQQSAQMGQQIGALYRFRRRYWEQELASGDLGFAATLARRMADIWREEADEARGNRNFEQMAILQRLAPLVPGLHTGPCGVSGSEHGAAGKLARATSPTDGERRTTKDRPDHER